MGVEFAASDYNGEESAQIKKCKAHIPLEMGFTLGTKHK